MGGREGHKLDVFKEPQRSQTKLSISHLPLLVFTLGSDVRNIDSRCTPTSLEDLSLSNEKGDPHLVFESFGSRKQF
jgi:hypothetical protein